MRMTLFTLRKPLALAVLLLAVGCSGEPTESSAPSDSAAATAPPPPARDWEWREDSAVEVQAAKDQPVLQNGPASGAYANFGIAFSFPSYYKMTEAPGLEFSVITLASGDSRIFVTVFKPGAVAAPAWATSLRQTIEKYYQEAVFPYKSPRLIQIGDGKADEARLRVQAPPAESELYKYDVSKPGTQPESETKTDDVEQHYTKNRMETWEGSTGKTDLYRRQEGWQIEKSIWATSERGSGNGKWEVHTGYCHFKDRRYTVIVEANNTGKPVRVVYFYPASEEPVMGFVKSTVQSSFRIDGANWDKPAPAPEPAPQPEGGPQPQPEG